MRRSSLLRRFVVVSALVTASAGCSKSESSPLQQTKPAIEPHGTTIQMVVGDGVLDAGEVCDDGNTWGGDGCDGAEPDAGQCLLHQPAGTEVPALGEGGGW